MQECDHASRNGGHQVLGASRGGVPLLQAETSRSTPVPTWISPALAQPRVLLCCCCWSLSTVPYPQNFTLGWKCPGLVSAEVLVTVVMLFRGVWVSSRARCGTGSSGRLLTWSINPAGDRGGQSRSSKALRAERRAQGLLQSTGTMGGDSSGCCPGSTAALGAALLGLCCCSQRGRTLSATLHALGPA